MREREKEGMGEGPRGRRDGITRVCRIDSGCGQVGTGLEVTAAEEIFGGVFAGSFWRRGNH